jgi:hypothetical protein
MTSTALKPAGRTASIPQAKNLRVIVAKCGYEYEIITQK